MSGVWLVCLGTPFDRDNGCSGIVHSLHMFNAQMFWNKCRVVMDSLGYSVGFSVYSQHNSMSIFMFRFVWEPRVGESASRHQNPRFFQRRSSQHSFCILSWVWKYSLSSLRICLFSWKYVWRFEGWASLSPFVFVFLWKLFFCLEMFLYLHRGETYGNVWYCSSVFHHVIEKLVFFF